MIGKKIQSQSHTYTIIKAIAADDRPNANIYLCIDENGKEFVAKHFYNGNASPFLGYGKRNHFGRRRDGSETVFYEIKGKSEKHDFLINHYERIRFEGRWIIIIEYIKGELVSNFISRECRSNLELVKAVVKTLAETINEWHSNGFAHGDPHLDNAIVQIYDGIPKITLIDYSLIHHQDFEYCKYIGCFGFGYDRLKEDLRNDSNMGPGFLISLEDLETNLGLRTDLSDTFNEGYNSTI